MGERRDVTDQKRHTTSNKRTVNILLLSKSARTLGSVRDLLHSGQRCQFQLRHVESLAECIECLLREDADALLLDLGHINFDPRDAVDAARVVAPHLPVVVLCDAAREECAAKLLEAGACDYLLREDLSQSLLERSVLYIMESRRLRDRIQHDSAHDSLTGLPNRQSMMMRLQAAINRAESDPSSSFALLFLDLDHFSKINDSLGHECGDQLLNEVSRRLQRCFREHDVVSRFGGDEFVVLLNDLQDISRAVDVAERIHEQLQIPVVLNEQVVFTTCSVGIAWSELQYQQAGGMIRDAHTAMYRAKALGRGCHALFDQSMRERALMRLKLEKELRCAINSEEHFLIHYQPIISLKTGRISGFEALMRWEHPQRGFISPGVFIPIAEEAGLIIPIGRWILRNAARQLQQWRKDFPENDLTMSVNVSSRELLQSDWLSFVDGVLEETGIEPGSLKLEITETAIIENDDVVSMTFQEIKRRGIKISIDDFGMGYSSLSYLHRFAFDTLKIDRSFVNRLTNDEENSDAFVRTIVALARTLEMEVIAEGVETPEQLAELERHECDFGQGFLFSRPVPARSATELLSQGPVGSLTKLADPILAVVR